MHRYRDTGIQGYRDTGIQRCRDIGIQEYNYKEIYKSMPPRSAPFIEAY